MRGLRPPKQSKGRQRRGTGDPRSGPPPGQLSLTQMAFGQPPREATPSVTARTAPSSPRNPAAAQLPIKDTAAAMTMQPSSVPLLPGKAAVGDVEDVFAGLSAAEILEIDTVIHHVVRVRKSLSPPSPRRPLTVSNHEPRGDSSTPEQPPPRRPLEESSTDPIAAGKGGWPEGGIHEEQESPQRPDSTNELPHDRKQNPPMPPWTNQLDDQPAHSQDSRDTRHDEDDGVVDLQNQPDHPRLANDSDTSEHDRKDDEEEEEQEDDLDSEDDGEEPCNFPPQFSQTYGDLDDIVVWTQQAELELSQQEETSPVTKRRKGNYEQKDITEFFPPTASLDGPISVFHQKLPLITQEQAILRGADGAPVLFHRHFTYRVKQLVDNKDKLWARHLISPKAGFRTQGSACVTNTEPGSVFIPLSETRFLGQAEATKLLKADIWKNFAEVDRTMATFHVRDGCLKYRGQNAFPLRLLDDSESIPTPSPPLFYEESGKIADGLNDAYFRYAADSYERKDTSYKPRVLDLCSGCGGFSLGLKAAGFKVTHAVDSDPNAMASYAYNSPDTEVYDEDAFQFLANCRDGKLGYLQPGEIDHIHASPPCQAYSSANRNTERTKGDMENIAKTFILTDAVRFLLPRTLTMENVKGMMDQKNIEYLMRVVRELLELEYQVRICLVDAASYGDPQHRERIILFASRYHHKLPDLPPPTHGDATTLKPYVTAKEVLDDLASISPTKGHTRAFDSSGKPLLQHWMDIRKCSTDKLDGTLKGDSPAPTILTKKAVRHYSLDRAISPRERARLQNIPDDFRFFGGDADVRRQIGNAVPVALATAVARAVRDSYNYVRKDRSKASPGCDD